jgi:two-component system, NarL family, nitrate/nitrite response regulator NarL
VNEDIRIKVDDMAKTSVLIAESHTLMRHALVALLREARPEWHCDDVEGLDELRARITDSSPTLALIDLRLCGLEGLRQLRLSLPHTTFVVLSDQDDRSAILACLEAGAQGYILKSTNPDQFVRALETILTGGLYAPASLSGMPIHPPITAHRAELQLSPVLSHLTERQRHVFELLAEGCATKTIARRLDLAVGTVKVHLAAIYRTLGASSRLEALAKAHRAYASV